MLWLVVVIVILGVGSYWGRKRVEKEVFFFLGGFRRFCFKFKGFVS